MAKDDIREVKAPPADPARGPDWNTYGLTGLKRFSGYVYEEFHNKLQGLQAVRVYREMQDNDATIGAVVFAARMLMRAVDWTVKPAEETREGLRHALFLEQCIADMSHTWEDFLAEILTMLTFGYSFFELCYKRRQGPSRDPLRNSRYSDGLLGWRKLEIRSQEATLRWEFDEADGGIKGLWQIPPPDYRLRQIPIWKGLLFRTWASKNNPEGYSILRPAYRSWYILKRLQEIEAIGMERDLAGLPVLQVPPEVTLDSTKDAIYTAAKELVTDLRRDEREGVVIPAEEYQDASGATIKTGWKLSLLSAAGSRSLDISGAIRRYQQDIAMTILADFILLGMDKVGSFALASSKTHLFGMALGAWVKSIAAVLNRFAVARLWDLNGFPRELMPEIVPGDVETPPLDELGAFLGQASAAGLLTPDIGLERHVRMVAGLPEPEDVESYGVQDTQTPPQPEAPAGEEQTEEASDGMAGARDGGEQTTEQEAEKARFRRKVAGLAKHDMRQILWGMQRGMGKRRS